MPNSPLCPCTLAMPGQGARSRRSLRRQRSAPALLDAAIGVAAAVSVAVDDDEVASGDDMDLGSDMGSDGVLAETPAGVFPALPAHLPAAVLPHLTLAPAPAVVQGSAAGPSRPLALPPPALPQRPADGHLASGVPAGAWTGGRRRPWPGPQGNRGPRPPPLPGLPAVSHVLPVPAPPVIAAHPVGVPVPPVPPAVPLPLAPAAAEDPVLPIFGFPVALVHPFRAGRAPPPLPADVARAQAVPLAAVYPIPPPVLPPAPVGLGDPPTAAASPAGAPLLPSSFPPTHIYSRLLALRSTGSPLLCLEPLLHSTLLPDAPLMRVSWRFEQGVEERVLPMGSQARHLFVGNLLTVLTYNCFPFLAAVLRSPGGGAAASALLLQFSSSFATRPFRYDEAYSRGVLRPDATVALTPAYFPALYPGEQRIMHEFRMQHHAHLLPPYNPLPARAGLPYEMIIPPCTLPGEPLHFTLRWSLAPGVPPVDLVRVKVRGLHPDLQRRGCVSLLLQRAGYSPGDFQVLEECLPSVVLAGWERAGGGNRHGDSRVGGIGDLSSVLALVRPPSADPTLSRAAGSLVLPTVPGRVSVTVRHAQGSVLWVPGAQPLPPPRADMPPPLQSVQVAARSTLDGFAPRQQPLSAGSSRPAPARPAPKARRAPVAPAPLAYDAAAGAEDPLSDSDTSDSDVDPWLQAAFRKEVFSDSEDDDWDWGDAAFAGLSVR